ncbi:MAG: hypothetical protein H6729_06430 [Deltaproteobacteria bacterium]|nr:hypothetical protein [Deltaproteobacteria bacterium]
MAKAPAHLRLSSSLGRRVPFALLSVVAASVALSGQLPAQTAPAQTAPAHTPPAQTAPAQTASPRTASTQTAPASDPEQVVADPESSDRSVSVILEQLTALAGPLGIDPLLAMAMFGLAGWLGIWTPPPGMRAFTMIWVWVTLILLALLLKLGRSSKFTKPFTEAVAGPLESGGGLVVAGAMVHAFANPQPSATVEAGLVQGGLLMIMVVSSVGAIMVLRTALDILIWLSPIPFVDFLFQVAKTILTIGLVALAIFFPTAAVVINVLIILTTAVLVGWATRAATWGLSIVWDLTVGRFSRPSTLPRDAVVAEDIGPLSAFVVEVGSLPRRSACQLELRAGRWFLHKQRALRKPVERPLGDASRCTFATGWTGTVIALPEGRILLPPRYNHLIATLARETGAALADDRAARSDLRTALNLRATPGHGHASSP